MPEAKAGIICDAWTGGFATSKGEHLTRQAFYSTHRIQEPFKFVGGWSAHGQPVDQLHATFRKRIRAMDISSLGMIPNLRERPRYPTELVCDFLFNNVHIIEITNIATAQSNLYTVHVWYL